MSAARATGLAVAAALALAAPAVGAGPAAAEPGKCAGAADDVIRSQPWAQAQLGFERAWTQTTGAGITVAVVDTGVSSAAPTLRGAVLAGKDFVSNGRADVDCAGHGTFVAGLIASRPVRDVLYAGIAPGVRILPVRVADDPGQVDPALLAQGIVYAVNAGAKVIDVPLGAKEEAPGLRNAVRYAASKGRIVVAAVDGALDDAGRTFPASYPEVLTASPLNPDGSSAVGVSSKSTVHVDLTAPGASLIGVGPAGAGHLQASGTGLATAFVAGAAALTWSYYPTLTAAQVRARLLATADHLATKVPDAVQGYGAVNPEAAVREVLPGAAAAVPSAPAKRLLDLPVRVVPDRGPARTALAVAAALVLLASLFGIGAAMVRRARDRGRAARAAGPRTPARKPRRRPGRRDRSGGAPAEPDELDEGPLVVERPLPLPAGVVGPVESP